MLKTIINKLTHGTTVVIKVAALTHCTFEYLFDFVVCNGPSMEPTLFSNNVLLTDRLSIKRGKLSRGDVVIARNPEKPYQLICKRVLGTSGDMIRAQVKGGGLLEDTEFPFSERVLIDALEEYEHSRRVHGKEPDNHLEFRDVVVPPGHVWLEGDNSANSSDSRHYGPVPKGLIQSRVLLRLFPFSSIRFI